MQYEIVSNDCAPKLAMLSEMANIDIDAMHSYV